MTPSIQAIPNDAEARRRICESLDESLVVEASAGTGKTTELVNRIVQVLAAGRTSVDKIVAVTFTHKAAGELKIRVRQKLDDARAKADIDPETRGRLERALEELEEAAIGTIHGFCAQILRSRPVEAHIDPAFEELTEGEAARIFDRAFNRWFQRQLDTDSPGLKRALARLAWREDRENGPAIEQLKMAGRRLTEWRDFTAEWQPEPYDRNAAVEALLAGARTLWKAASACPRATDALVTSLRPLRDLLGWIDRGRVCDHDTLEAVLLKLGRDLKSGSGFRKGSGFFSTEFSARDRGFRLPVVSACLEQFRVDSGVLSGVPVAARDAPAAGRLRRPEAAHRPARFRRSSSVDARPGKEATPPFAATCRNASRTFSWTNFRIPIRCRPRFCCCCRPAIRRDGLDRGCSRARQVVSGRRSQAIDL